MDIKKILITCTTKTDAKKLRKLFIKLGINWIDGQYSSDINKESDWISRWEENGKQTIYCINNDSNLYFGSYNLYYKIYFKSIYNKYTSYTVDEFIEAYGKETNTRNK